MVPGPPSTPSRRSVAQGPSPRLSPSTRTRKKATHFAGPGTCPERAKRVEGLPRGNDYALEVVHHKARKLVGTAGFREDDVEDIKQDLIVDLLERLPKYRFSETHLIADSRVTNEYKGKLFRLTGKTNNGAWGGFAEGEVLFLGASGSKRGRGDWEITFSFAASPNATGLTVGDISDIDKKGWEYLWVEYAESVDESANPKRLVKRPVAVHVERVYEAGDFADLEPPAAGG